MVVGDAGPAHPQCNPVEAKDFCAYEVEFVICSDTAGQTCHDFDLLILCLAVRPVETEIASADNHPDLESDDLCLGVTWSSDYRQIGHLWAPVLYHL